jgi:DNA-binding IscR family transcriptional regulator
MNRAREFVTRSDTISDFALFRCLGRDEGKPTQFMGTCSAFGLCKKLTQRVKNVSENMTRENVADAAHHKTSCES